MSDRQPIRIAIITQDEPFVVPLLLEELLPLRAESISAIFIADDPLAPGPVATMRRWAGVLDTLSFMRYGFAYAWARFRGTGPRRTAQRHAVACETVDDVNAPEFLNRLHEMQIDLVISVACPQIFRKHLLELPRLGCINVHSGPLPRYRGMLPTFWVLYEGEEATAVTVHVMNERLDDGEIVLQETVPIPAGETQANLMRRCKIAGGRLLAQAIDLLESDRVELRPNLREDATWYSFPTPEQARRFRQQGGRWM